MENNHWKNMIAELIDYTFPQPWRPIDVFLDLIRLKFITLNPATGVITQHRNFKHGGQLEKPIVINPIKRGRYYRLQIVVGGFDAGGHRTPRLRVTVKLHRLVQSSTNGPIPSWMDVDHINRRKDQNGTSNLQVLSPQQHIDRNKQTGVYENSQNQPQLSEDDPVIEEIKTLHKSGLSYRDIAEQVGFSKDTCRKIVIGSYKFKQQQPEPDCVDPEDEAEVRSACRKYDNK